MRQDRTYLDYNATAPLLPAARDAVLAALDLAGNPSSVHQDGRVARAMIERARRDVAALVGADAAHVTLTSGASEAASHVLTPEFRMGRAVLKASRLYVSAIEHPCVLSGGRFAPEDVCVVPVLGDGTVDLAALSGALASHDRIAGVPVVAVMLANNESGVVQPVGRVAEAVRAAGGILVVDAVQAAGRIPVDIAALGADFLILSSHKMGGPKGVGALVARGETMMPGALVTGGGQEKGHRSGTENLPGIAGFGAAAQVAATSLGHVAARTSALRDRLEAGIRRIVPDALIVSETAERLPNTSFFAVPGMKAETMQIGFDLEGISVSAGSACSSGKVGESHVLSAMGLDAPIGALRISLGAGTGEADIDRALSALERMASKRAMAAA
jgi:cysteine desulfurase